MNIYIYVPHYLMQLFHIEKIDKNKDKQKKINKNSKIKCIHEAS